MKGSPGEWVEGSALAAFLGGLPVYPFLGPQAAQLMLPVCVLIALVGRWMQGRPLFFQWDVAGAAAAFLAWAALSLAWSADPAMSAGWWAQIALELPFAVALVFLMNSILPIIFYRYGLVFLVGLVLSALLVAVELATAGVFHGLLSVEPYEAFVVNRQLVVAALLSLPAASILWSCGARLLAVLAVAVTALICGFGDSETAIMVLGVGLATFGLARLAPTAVAAALAIGLPLCVMLAPILPRYAMESLPAGLLAWRPGTVRARLEIWTAVSRLIEDAPLFGQGLSAIRNLKIPEVAWLFEDEKVTHAHNAALQVWLDLGLVGAAFLAAALLALVGVAWRTPDPARALGLATVAALAAAISTSWSLWAAWWLASLAGVVAALVLARRVALLSPTSLAQNASPTKHSGEETGSRMSFGRA